MKEKNAIPCTNNKHANINGIASKGILFLSPQSFAIVSCISATTMKRRILNSTEVILTVLHITSECRFLGDLPNWLVSFWFSFSTTPKRVAPQKERPIWRRPPFRDVLCTSALPVPGFPGARDLMPQLLHGSIQGLSRSDRKGISWLWVKNRFPKWNPGKWKHGLKPAVPCWFSFDPCPVCEMLEKLILACCRETLQCLIGHHQHHHHQQRRREHSR